MHLEIACDESGFSGGNLVGRDIVRCSPMPASVSIQIPRANWSSICDSEIGARGEGEYKSAEILRPRRRPIVLWLLGPSSPIYGNAHVHLTDTRFFVLARMVDVLLGGRTVRGIACPGRDRRTRPMALALYRSGEQSYGPSRWQEFLTLSANLFRTNNRWLPKAPVPMFYAAVDGLARARAPSDITEVMIQLRPTRPIAEATRASYLNNPKLTPLMEPLLPAFSRAVDHWGSQAQTLGVVHDEQSALTPERIADIATAFTADHRGHELTEVRFADSSREPAVQIADFVAGIARRVASEELKSRADGQITALLGPLVDHESVWVDGRSLISD